MKEYFVNLFQDVKQDVFHGKDNVEIIIELVAHAINISIIASVVCTSVQEYLKFLNN